MSTFDAKVERVTHGRHCRCSACAREDWADPQIAPCGMHGEACPRRYDPLGAPGDVVRRDRRPTSPVTFSVRIETTLHVTLELPYDGHPDFIDGEQVAADLDAYIESNDGDLPPGARLDYASVSSESEAW